jgi:transcription termination/antitermination protein NusA
MAHKSGHTEVDLSESSIYGKNADADEAPNGDGADEATIDRLEAFTGGADEPGVYEGKLGRRMDTLDATTDEEIDALKLDLSQEDERANARDGSGRIVDDVAEEQLAEFTEVGPDLDGEGAESFTAGRDDTSATLRRHHPNTDVARADAVVEGNLDKPSDETREDGFVDAGTAG